MWIAASYKTNRYQKWIEKGKKKLVDNNSDDEEGEENQGRITNKSGRNFKGKYFVSFESIMEIFTTCCSFCDGILSYMRVSDY